MFHHVMLAAACNPSASDILPDLYSGLCQGGQVSVSSLNDILILLGNIVRVLVAAAGALAVIFIMIGGIFYVTATGDPGKLQRAKEILNQAITGLVVISLAYAIVTFITAAFK